MEFSKESFRKLDYLYECFFLMEIDEIYYPDLIYRLVYLRLMDEKLNTGIFKKCEKIKDITFEKFLDVYEERTRKEESVDNITALILIHLRRQNISKAKLLLKILSSIDINVAEEIMRIDLYNIYANKEVKNYTTPYSICDLASRILDIKSDDAVADFCSGTGTFLFFVNNKFNVENLYGSEINFEYLLTARARFIALGKPYVINGGNVFNANSNDSDENKKFDKIFSDFPTGLNLSKGEIETIFKSKKMLSKWKYYPAISIDWLFVNVVLSEMKEKGKTVVLISDGPLFKTIDIQFKEELIKRGYIESVIRLPLSVGKKMIPYNLLVLSNGNKEVKFIDASRSRINDDNIDVDDIYELYTSKEKNEKITVAAIKDIEEKEFNLSVQAYIKEDLSDGKLGKIKSIENYIDEVFRGYQAPAAEIKKLENENGEYELLTISDIDNGIISDELLHLEYDKRLERYVLKEDDIVITSKGNNIKVAVASRIGNRKIVAHGNLIVIRLKGNKLNSNYLAMFLNSSYGRRELFKLQTGSVIFSINPNQIKQLQIFDLERYEQEKLSKKYLSKKQQYVIAKNHLNLIEKEIECFFENETERLLHIDE